MRVSRISVICAALMLVPLAARAQIFAQGGIVRSDQVEKVQSGEIDWGTGYYYAGGEGAVPSADEEPNRAKAYLKAKGYAKMQAIANLRMAIEGTTVSYKATGKDCLGRDEELRQTIEGYVANVEIVGEKQRTEGADTTAEVTVRAPMYGQAGIATAVLKSKTAREMSSGSDASVDKRGDAKASSIAASAKGPFSSLIVDCGGFSVQRAINPKIRRADGSEVWGTLGADLGFLQEHGIAAYARSLDDAKRSPRAGSNPLTLKAIGRAGGKYYCDAVLSDPDADRAIQENQSAHFLDNFNVIFVVD